MRHTYRNIRTFILALTILTALSPLVQAQGRTEITINDTGVSPENLTSSQDGTVYIGSRGKGNIYRAAPGASQAEPWIQASETGLTNVFGVLADDKTSTLWVCSNSDRRTRRLTGRRADRRAHLRLEERRPQGHVSDSRRRHLQRRCPGGGRDRCTSAKPPEIGVLRLKPGATTPEVWIVDQQLAGVDGISMLADGAVYVNTYFAGLLLRIPVAADGSAGPMVQLEPSIPIKNPDGLRAIGPRTFLQIENAGRVTEITVNGNRRGGPRRRRNAEWRHRRHARWRHGARARLGRQGRRRAVSAAIVNAARFDAGYRELTA